MVSVGSEKPIYASAHVLSVPVLGWGGVRERGRERQKDRERKKHSAIVIHPACVYYYFSLTELEMVF